MSYFTDRVLGQRPRTREEITEGVWKGIVIAISTRLRDGSFGKSYPRECEDGRGVSGAAEDLLGSAIEAYFPGLVWPLDVKSPPEEFKALDLVEFCYEKVAYPTEYEYHSFWGHSHLSFDVVKGRTQFRDEINKLFAQNSLAFELADNGQVVRIAPPVATALITSLTFRTGDSTLDQLLDTAVSKYLSRDPATRQEGLEKLWDAWERLKTLDNKANKKKSTKILLDRAGKEPGFRALLESEAMQLTSVGNDFMIRHTEATKTKITSREHVDYLFHRMFALIWLALRMSGRVK